MEKTRINLVEAKPRAKAPRDFIALFITLSVVTITIIVALYSLWVAPVNDKGVHDFSFVGQTLLPLWSTWIGTVFAYYFGKANFEAGTRSYQEAMKSVQSSDEIIARLRVQDVMLPIKDIVYLDLETESPKLIHDILKYPQFEPYNRFAVMDKNKVVKYMIHRSTFYQFIYNSITGEQATAADALTLADLLACTDEKIKNTLTRGIGFVSVNANLLEAKRVVDATEECQDVFITQSGKSSDAVLGLITNNRIFQYAKV